jgi:hypothetical protein
MTELAPIILFTYNRPYHTQRTLDALMQNELADESILYLYCDGPKEDATDEQKQKIAEVRHIIREKRWCKEVQVIEFPKNKGLANSIINGVTEVIEKHGKVIVLEDDIITSKGFLKYMNDALRIHEKNVKVMHISAYMYPHSEKLPDTFFFNVPYPGGGWATWKRAWNYFNPDARRLYNYFEERKLWNTFNKFGGKYLQKQLQANMEGSLKTWFIKWHATLIIQNGFTLYPSCSLTNNIGFDEEGTHCTPMTKFDIHNLAASIPVEDIPLIESKKAKRIIIRFYQGRFYPVRRFLINMTPEFIKPFVKKNFLPK